MLLQIIDYKKRGSYAHVTDGKNIMYVQYNGFGSFLLATTHQPSREVGTSFQLMESVGEKDLIEAIKKNLHIVVPAWATNSDFQATKKWPSVEAFLTYEHKFWDDAHLAPFSIEAIKNGKK